MQVLASGLLGHLEHEAAGVGMEAVVDASTMPEHSTRAVGRDHGTAVVPLAPAVREQIVEGRVRGIGADVAGRVVIGDMGLR